jgi:hypothetical protein
MRASVGCALLFTAGLFMGCDDGGQRPDTPPTAGLVLHVESDTGVTLAGSAVTKWLDQSAFKNDGAPLPKAPTPGAQNLAGTPTVRFAGDAGPMAGPQGFAFSKPISNLAGSTTFALVLVQDPGTLQNDISLSLPELQGVDSDAATIGARGLVFAGVLRVSYSAGGQMVEANLPLGQWVLISATLERDGKVRLFADGVKIADGTIGPATNEARTVTLSGGLTSAETAAVLVYDRSLPDSDRVAVENYVLRKWKYR